MDISCRFVAFFFLTPGSPHRAQVARFGRAHLGNGVRAAPSPSAQLIVTSSSSSPHPHLILAAIWPVKPINIELVLVS